MYTLGKIIGYDPLGLMYETLTTVQRDSISVQFSSSVVFHC